MSAAPGPKGFRFRARDQTRFDDRIVKYDFGELDEVSLAYAVTIHKAQG